MQPAFRHIFCAETHLDQLPMDENRVLLTGENPFIRLNAEGPDGEATTNASFWRILYWCAAARNRDCQSDRCRSNRSPRTDPVTCAW